MLAVRVLAVVGVAQAAACYDPSPATNLPCGAGEVCPRGQRCSAALVCVPDGTAPDIDAPPGEDAPSDAADADAMVDASLDAMVDAPMAAPPMLRSFIDVDGTDLSTTVSSPAGTQIGDLLLAHVNADSEDAATIDAPAGWTRVADEDGTGEQFGVAVFYRFATATSQSFTFRFADNFNHVHLMAFSGVNAAMPIDASGTMSLPDTDQPTAPSVTTTRANTLLVVLFTLDRSQDSFESIAGMTEVYDIYTGELRVSASIAPVPTAGATGIRVATRSGTDVGEAIGITVALSPN